MPVYWTKFYLVSNKFPVLLNFVHYVDDRRPIFDHPVRCCRCCSASVRRSKKTRIFAAISASCDPRKRAFYSKEHPETEG